MPQRRDNADAVCNSGMGILFLCIYFSYSCPECGIAELSLLLFVSSSWSTSTTSLIRLFELVRLNDLLFDHQANNVVKEVDVKDALKSSIFVVQKAAAPKTGVEFCQGSIGTIRSSLATSYDVQRRREGFWSTPTHPQRRVWRQARCLKTSALHLLISQSELRSVN